jgi:hypothetical protein
MRRDITLQEAGDVMTTALEGGIGYWSAAADIVRDPELTCVSYKLYDAEYPSDSPESLKEATFQPAVVTRQMVKDAWAKICDDVNAGNPPFCQSYLRQMHEDAADPGDAGMVDAGVSDCIVQIAILGEVVFG